MTTDENVHYTRNTCRLCGSKDIPLVLPLEKIPVVTPNIGSLNEYDTENINYAPIDLYQCQNCQHIQLLDMIKPEFQYRNFKYKTTVSPGLPEHFITYAKDCIERLQLAPNSLVIEIGSNDGTLLKAFKAQGMKVLGIDPAREIARQATADGVETIDDFFNTDVANFIVNKYGKADLVVANNTIANIDDVKPFAEAIKMLIATNSHFVFETSYGYDVIQDKLLDTIYHEHLSYFMVSPLVKFFDSLAMTLYDVQKIHKKGGSIRGWVQLCEGSQNISTSLAEFTEQESRLSSNNGIEQFKQWINSCASEVNQIISTSPLKVSTFGASVGSITLLHQLKLGQRLTVMYDDSPVVDSIFSQQHIIPVQHSDTMYDTEAQIVIILAWRYADRILARHAELVKRGWRFISILPEVRWL
ncbi:MAG: methyltransferase domain-containing protein [Gammaproteobacteria bacterium]|nr:methyltransferase domain-containing protein [Gammaproteobacteria bacterium]